jgi:hypothetical protein
MTKPRCLACLALLLLALAACSQEELTGTASRTLRNVCAGASNCTVYGEDGQAQKGLDPWDTKR